MHPLISIIIPVYNAAKYLCRCIDSILTQSYTDFELLLIDDGSKDASGAICDAYAVKDSRVRVFHKENGGVSSARNVGLDNAQGEYITFCDADDYVGAGWLEAYHGPMSENIDFIVQGYHRVVADVADEKLLQPMRGDTKPAKQEMVKHLVTSSCFGYIWVKAFRQSLIEEHRLRFDESSSFTEDAQFIAEYLVYSTSFQILDKAYYYYIVPDRQKKYSGDNFYSILRVCQSFKGLYDGCLPVEFCSRYFSYIKNGAIEYLKQGKALETFHLELYKDMVEILKFDRNLKDKVRNMLILKSRHLGRISIWGIELMSKIIK